MIKPFAHKLPSAMYKKYLQLFPMRRNTWHKQERYTRGASNRWLAQERELSDQVIQEHLNRSSDFWIACRCNGSKEAPETNFILLDFDADHAGSPDPAWRRLQAVIDVIGRDVPPLLYCSPGGGYHAIWFLDESVPWAELVDLRAKQSRGLVPEILRTALEEIGTGICEIYPQERVVRWPLGRWQYPVDPATGAPILTEDVTAMINAAFAHYTTQARLTLTRLRSLRPAKKHPSVHGAAAVDATRTPRVMRTPGVPAAVSPEAIERARDLYANGLSAFGTRNDAMFLLARVMVHVPGTVSDPGFVPAADLAEQLCQWLEQKHNGFSKDYPGGETADRAYWLAEAGRILANVIAGPSCLGLLREGRLLLTEAEWDVIFRVGYHGESRPAKRYRLEVVAASVVAKAKWSVAKNRTPASIDGTYTAEIHSTWLRQVKFCASSSCARKYRKVLEQMNLFRLEKRGSKAARRANWYSGFYLDFESPHRELPYRPALLAAMARQLKVETPVLQYCLEVCARFGGDEPERVSRRLQSRYGASGANFVTQYMRAMAKHNAELDVRVPGSPPPFHRKARQVVSTAPYADADVPVPDVSEGELRAAERRYDPSDSNRVTESDKRGPIACSRSDTLRSQCPW